MTQSAKQERLERLCREPTSAIPSRSDAVVEGVQDRLNKLKKLMEDGHVTEEEYARERQRILGSI
jgi:hypothetical protein